MEKNLEQLRKEMFDALKAYETFKKNNSRELTEDEKNNEPQPTFIGVTQSETRMFELTKEKVDEMRRLEQNLRDTQYNYMKAANENTSKDYQKEYEAYMKQITDAFIAMNGDAINSGDWHKDTSVFYEVIWTGGIEFSFDLNCSLAFKGMTYEEMKKWNANISRRYLNENLLTYDEWLLKYKQ